MAYKKNRSKKCNSWIGPLVFLGVVLVNVNSAVSWAAFASKFLLSVGEQYTDNVFFSKDKEHDFVTVLTPTLTLLFAPQGEIAPTANINFSPSAQLFSQHSELNNFGRTMSMNAGYTEKLTPRLSLYLADTLSRTGASRTGDFGAGGLLATPTATPGVGGLGTTPGSQNLKDFTSVGDTVTNNFSVRGTFLYQPNISFNADYSNNFTKFLSRGGSDITQTIGARGVYNWRQEHNLHAGYSVSIANARNGDDALIHNFDIGDDFFSNAQIRLSPTLTIALSSGFGINTGTQGPRIANNTNLTVTKLWQTATLTGGMRKGLTPSFGVSGISDTTSFFTDFDSRITDRLTGKVGTSFSFYDTDDVKFKTLQATAGLQYLINSWLSSNLSYNFRSTNSGVGASTSTLLQKGTVSSNTIFLSLSAQFDLWPNPGLSRGISSLSAVPIITPPFSSGPAPAGSSNKP